MHLQLHTTSMSQLLRRLLLPGGTNSNSTPLPPGPLVPSCWLLLLLSRSCEGPTKSPGAAAAAAAAGVLALLPRGTWVGAVLAVGHAHSQEPPDKEVSDRNRMMSFTCRFHSELCEKVV
jgi:hypothetical protein